MIDLFFLSFRGKTCLRMSQVIEVVKNVSKNPVVRTAVLILVPTVVSVVAFRKYKRAQRRKAYPKDVVILHQYPNGFRAPSPSPWSLKLETWLRMAKIPYQVRTQKHSLNDSWLVVTRHVCLASRTNKAMSTAQKARSPGSLWTVKTSPTLSSSSSSCPRSSMWTLLATTRQWRTALLEHSSS